ncbi:hypothetical protein EMIHUDRAFT_257014 [Emiliania huxleyi CCMP1516]|uniref:Uncharacterized protein n=2 Tax=Emiliania huxleyi TaxID=2903 RepID=A0A0D3INY6_EMIH1|nr:hypothetical protein EMIHUDRAFT_257014 [Emiliania huxleyi CCMP1516]EOD12971.1 hypothetical protein EMIHUDRAFT_257014 [Emiliania huxleyi CCMP1516]|eukprot:XP_005765400.1 hypothetical protein EMIHUDRAFT_257014 [Emiliania huxleyi CCMP1516]
MQRTLALLLAFACTALLLLREQRRFVLATSPGGSAALEAYCGAPPQGSEGKVTADGLKLVGVLVTIRHGDRSSIHSLPNTNTTARWMCRPVGSEQKQAAAQVAVVGLDGSPFYRPLLPKTLPGRHGDCAPGQLTPRGFAQHVALGRHAVDRCPMRPDSSARASHRMTRCWVRKLLCQPPPPSVPH